MTNGELPARAMTKATSTIPIVFASHADPVGTKLVESFAHPGGNVTGVSEMAPELAGKRLQLLKEAVPTMARVGAIWNAGEQAMAREYGETLVGAEAGGVSLQNLSVRTPDDLDRAYQTAVAGQLDGIVVILDPMIVRSRDLLVELSTRSGLPTISADTGFAAAGGLMAFEPNFAGQTQRAAYYVDRILRGAKPAELPVEQPTRFDFVINGKTAQTLGLSIPEPVLREATELIHRENYPALTREYGDPEADAVFLRDLSPVWQTDRIRVPLLVMHGANDPWVPIAQSELVVAALRARRAPVQFLRFEDEGHTLARRDNRLRAYSAVSEFLAGILAQ